VDVSPESGHQSLERVREAVDKVRKVLGELDSGSPRAGGREAAALPVQGSPARGREDEELRAHEAARLLNLPLQELYALVRDHRLAARRLGRFLWFRRADVEAFASRAHRSGSRRRPDQKRGR
jgi:excisionase family DNA binding protein